MSAEIKILCIYKKPMLIVKATVIDDGMIKCNWRVKDE